MSRPLSVAVVGLGKIAQIHHLPNLAASPLFDVTAVVDLDASLSQRVRDQFAPRSEPLRDVSEVFDLGVDGLIVANRDHSPVIVEALRRHIPVFVEKPLCWTTAEGAQLIDLTEASGTPVVVGYMKRYDPAFEYLFNQLVESDVIYVRVHNFAGGRHKFEPLYRVMKPFDKKCVQAEAGRIRQHVCEEIGSGAPGIWEAFQTFCELAVHDFNLLRALFGNPVIESVREMASPGRAGYLITLSFGGVSCVVELLADFSSRREWDETVTVHTAREALEVRFGNPFVRNAPSVVVERTWNDGDVVRQLVLSRASPFLVELDHFHQVVSTGCSPRTNVREACEDLQFVYDLTKCFMSTR